MLTFLAKIVVCPMVESFLPLMAFEYYLVSRLLLVFFFAARFLFEPAAPPATWRSFYE